MADGKPCYASVMNRAIGDPRLTDGEFRVLAVILSYDRLSSVSKKGQGAWASHRTMAKRLGVNYTYFSAAVSKLLELGYLVRERRAPPNATQFIYRGVYINDEEWAAYQPDYWPDKLGVEQTTSPETVCRGANHPTETVCRAVQDSPEIVCRGNDVSDGTQTENQPQYIPRRGGIDSVETGEIDSEESARLKTRRLSRKEFKVKFDGNEGGQLARFERTWNKDPAAYDRQALKKWAAYCFAIEDSSENGDPLFHQAQRLGQEIEDYISGRRSES